MIRIKTQCVNNKHVRTVGRGLQHYKRLENHDEIFVSKNLDMYDKLLSNRVGSHANILNAFSKHTLYQTLGVCEENQSKNGNFLRN